MNISKTMGLLHDKDFRQKLQDNPYYYAQDIGSIYDDDTEIVIVKNTKHIIYFPIIETNDNIIDIERVQAGGATAGSLASVGTAGTGGTASCPALTVSSIGTIGTVGSVGSVSSK